MKYKSGDLVGIFTSMDGELRIYMAEVRDQQDDRVFVSTPLRGTGVDVFTVGDDGYGPSIAPWLDLDTTHTLHSALGTYVVITERVDDPSVLAAVEDTIARLEDDDARVR